MGSSILIVEDDSEIRSGLVEFQKLFFDHVYCASNGSEGYENYKRYQPDVMLIDLNLPMMNGLELMKKIRLNDKQTKLVVLSAHSHMQDISNAKSLDIYKYFVKPFNANEFSNTMKILCKDIRLAS